MVIELGRCGSEKKNFLINDGGTVVFVVNPAAVRSSTLRVPLGAAPALKTAAFRRPARRSSGWCCFVQGTTNWGETPDVGRPNERATAASVSRSGEAIHTTERLARRWLEVMTRAVWEAGLCPLLTQHAKMGIAHAVPTARGCLLEALCGMPRVDFATQLPPAAPHAPYALPT